MTQPIPDLTIAVESPSQEETFALIVALNLEICQLYPGEDPHPYIPLGVQLAGGVFLAARLGGRAVGCVGLRPMPDRPGVAEVKRMYVVPDLRSRHIGERLMMALEGQAVSLGYHTLILETGAFQPDAIRLYERIGYQPTPCWGNYEDEAESRCYRKALAPPAWRQSAAGSPSGGEG